MSRRSRPLAAALLLAATLGAGKAAAPVGESPEIRQAAAKITEDVLRAHTKFLASDLLEGRGPATRGDALAEAYLQAQMESLGLKPGAPGGGWIQKVPLVGVKASFPGPALFRSERGSVEGTPGGNFVAFSGVQKPAAKIEHRELHQCDDQSRWIDAKRRERAFDAWYVAVMIGAPYIDHRIEATFDLVEMVRDIGCKIRVLSVFAPQHAVFFVAECARAKPRGAILDVQSSCIIEKLERVPDLIFIIERLF